MPLEAGGLAAFEERLLALEERSQKLERRLRSGRGFTDNPLALSTDLIDLGQVSSCAIHQVDDKTIGNASWTTVLFNTVTWDTDQMADRPNNRIVIRRAGIYLVTFNGAFATHATGNRGIRLYANGTIAFGGQSMSAHGTTASRLSCSTPRYFDLGDYMTAKVYQNSGGNLTLFGSTATSSGPQLTATLVSDTGDIRTEMA